MIADKLNELKVKNLEFNHELLNPIESQLIEAGLDGSAVLGKEIPTDIKIGTHSGTFHADEILSIALLRLWQPQLQYVRTRDPEILAGTIRVDVDEGLLDHHGIRTEPGVAACSRVYSLLVQSGALPAWACPVLEPLVNVVAAWDTGDASQPHPLPYIHALAHAADVTGGDENAAFATALDMCEKNIHALLAVAEAAAGPAAIAASIIAQQPEAAVISFPSKCRSADVKQLLYAAQHPAIYYISPASQSDWRVFCCAPLDQHYSPFASKMQIPERFRGLRGAALATAAGLPANQAIFCHKTGFTAGFTTCDAAEAFAQLCLTDA
ncbi:MAG: MYG1 family protein [Lentisphaeria bacterium]|nr:MYG1 family protein [Lentisphaeria bacterium]